MLAPPVLAMRAMLEEVAPHLQDGCVVTDVASTKVDVERWALNLLPSHAHWVGGHPMAGKETAGLEHADAALFRDRMWCIVPPPNATEPAVALITDLARATGARTMTIDAATHDQAVAAVSHLPFMAATAIAHSVIQREQFGSFSQIAGTGLRDMTRLASGDAVMHRDICLTNRDNVVRELERYVALLNEAIDLLRHQPAADGAAADSGARAVRALEAYFLAPKRVRDAWLRER